MQRTWKKGMWSSISDAIVQRIVIVGGGVAAQQCALELRARGFDGSVTVLSAEPRPPYDRTLLSKEMLAWGEEDLAFLNLELTPTERYEELDITLELGVSASGLDVRARRVLLADGREIRFDRLIVCTGGRPSLPSGLACRGVLVLREMQDAEALRSALESCDRLLIVGAGFVGGEVAASVVARGVEVELVEALSAPLTNVVGDEVARRLVALHQAHGVRLTSGTSVSSIRRRSRRLEVTLADGTMRAADAVLVAVGMVPQTSWIDTSSVRTGDGILTDSMCRTSVPGVFAAGDCARWWHPRYNTAMRVEHWDTAWQHGKAAAAAVLDVGEPFAPVPFFWSSQHGIRLQWIGHAPRWDRVDLEDIDGPQRFIARYYWEGQLAAAFVAGAPRALAAARAELELAGAGTGGSR
jgi:3-phenylpropionate/trans-cinnamate dioxygenase ferredoxin reductase component